jgi:DNA-binding CsgD family transcriptional regulator
MQRKAKTMNKMIISCREQEILRLVSVGYTTKEIADQLYLSHFTVETHRKKICKKLGALNSASLVRKGFEHGILTIN